jgi:hypothetical protein
MSAANGADGVAAPCLPVGVAIPPSLGPRAAPLALAPGLPPARRDSPPTQSRVPTVALEFPLKTFPLFPMVIVQ